MCLKSLILPSKIWNIYEEKMPKWSFISNTDIDISEDIQGVWFDFPQGCYGINDLEETFQTILDIHCIPINFSIDSVRNRFELKLRMRYIEESEVFTLYLNGYFTRLLGFSAKGEDMRFDLTIKSKHIKAMYPPNIYAFTSKSIIVTCDIVDETIFNGQRLNLLRLINKMDIPEDTYHYDFINDKHIKLEAPDTLHYHFIHDEYIKLGTHEFDKIKIRISDVTGNLLKVKYPDIETTLQLEFKESS